MADLSDVSTSLALGLVAVTLSLFWLKRKNTSRDPPGPPVLIPGFGHLLQMSSQPVQQLRLLRQRYGDVFRLYMGSYPVVIVSGAEMIADVLQTRGAEFSHRPPSFLAETLANNKGLLNTSGSTWLEQRKTMIRTLKMQAATGGHLETYIGKAAQRLTTQFKSLVDSGQADMLDVAPFIKRAVFFVSFSLAFGRQLDFDSEFLISYANHYDHFFRCLNLAVLTAFMPWISWLPGDLVGYKKCKETAEIIVKNYVEPEIARLKSIVNNNIEDDKDSSTVAPFCLASVYIDEMRQKEREGTPTCLSDEHLPITISDVIAGSFDTMSSGLCWMLLYLIHYTDVQETCRREILDNDCDLDIAKYVYTQAVIMEVQRHANMAPMPPAHCCDKDTEIGGYFVPKNTAIIINTDSLLMGPEVGDDPTAFRPERFIDDEGKLHIPKWFIPFSAGKRMCIGMAVARKELLGFIIELLSKFQFSAPKVNGRECMPPLEGINGISHSPKPFHLCVTLAGQRK
uniref:Cytochrome P450 n=1 Tax=Biomphalaria glabrata TaxID=6526 RepID=A0A2C9JYW4_BIOGL